MRVGIGHDTHRLEAGRPLILGGIRIEHARGLAGHSDADVVLHALTDALGPPLLEISATLFPTPIRATRTSTRPTSSGNRWCGFGPGATASSTPT